MVDDVTLGEVVGFRGRSSDVLFELLAGSLWTLKIPGFLAALGAGGWESFIRAPVELSCAE